MAAIVRAEGVKDAPAPRAATGESTPPTTIWKGFRHDAGLREIFFIDRSHGWAVGDRGVIWHTADGGATWVQQASGVACRLNSVCFSDAIHGWAVGGECQPQGDATRGIVLRTEDGGEIWTSLPQAVLPYLSRVKFFDEQRGIAVAQSTAAVPSSLFVTQDGGSSWQPLPTDQAGDWRTADFLDIETGAVAGPNGRFATLARRQLVTSPLAIPSLQSFDALRLIPPTGGWIVGQGGVIMTTSDLGHSWQTPAGEIPDEVRGHFDFHAVAVDGPRVWVAGAPGTRVFHSADGGATWHAFDTGQSAPIRSLCFVDGENGWAAGEFGTILSTHDGGQTWSVQRCGAKRAGLLTIFATAAEVPLELLAETGAEEGNIAVALILHRSSADANRSDEAIDERARQAMLLSGAAAANIDWRFPLPSDDLAMAPNDLLEALNRANDGRAVKQIERSLVRSLRTWRPDVVVTGPLDAAQNNPKSAFLAAMLMRSIEAAADPHQHVELESGAGLAAWQVKKVYALLPPTSRGGESINMGRFSPLFGTTLANFVAPARQLLHAPDSASVDTLELELVMSQTAAGSDGGLFAGLPASANGESRRPPLELPAYDLERLRLIATRRRHIEELMERSESNVTWLGQVANLTDELPTDDAAALLMRLADGYRAHGRLDLAADTYYLLARRYPEHPAVDRALMWLVQFYASSEAGFLTTHGTGTNVRGGEAVRMVDANVEQASLAPKDARPQAAGPAVGLSQDDRYRRAVQLTEYLQKTRPALFAEPSIRFAEATAQRQLGFANPAQRYFLTLRQRPANDPWRICGESEAWLIKPGDLPPVKKLAACRPAIEPPRLDGSLDESLWSTADQLPLRGGGEIGRRARRTRKDDETRDESHPPAATVRIAYDAEYLYLAVVCPKTPGGDYPSDERPRPRDADLALYDRVSLWLDIDRDFATAFELTIDCRGWTSEACWGNLHWNPDWFVASASDDKSWTAEAAIPLAELVPEPPAARHVWAVSARRTIPRIGYESWAGSDDAAGSPAQFGLVIFE